MKVNRSMPPPTVVPVLVYPDVRAAVAFLAAAFGFVERTRIGEGHRAQMAVGDDGAVIVADVGSDRGPLNRRIARAAPRAFCSGGVSAAAPIPAGQCCHHVGASLRHTGRMHLAQLNVGRLRAPMNDPMIADFRTNLARINALAEVSPGFVWRLQDDSGNATNIKPFGDELEIINLTVWESIEALADFTYRSAHVELLRRRRQFFEAATQAILCLWWVPEGTIPTVEEAIGRLEHLRANGPTPTAFTFHHRFEPGAEDAQLGSQRDVCPA